MGSIALGASRVSPPPVWCCDFIDLIHLRQKDYRPTRAAKKTRVVQASTEDSDYTKTMTRDALSLTRSQADLIATLERWSHFSLAIIHVVFGGWVLWDPTVLAAYVDLELAGPQAATELRAMYGGLIIGFGMIQVRGFLKPEHRQAATEATGWIFAGVALGRGIGFLSGPIVGLQPLFFAGEVALSAACWVAYRFAKR